MMMKKKIQLLISLMLVCFSAFADNVGTWNTVQLSKTIDSWTLIASEESRIGVDQSHSSKKFDEFHTTAGANYEAAKCLSIGVQDDYVLLRDGTDARYRYDNRPGVNIAVHRKIRDIMFLNRSRFVMRDIDGERPYFRYRNLSKVMTPALCSARVIKDIRLFSSYEWYFDEGSKDRNIRKNDKFCQFWTDFGLHAKVSQHTTIELFYRLVEVKSNVDHDWSPSHAICMALNFSF